MFTPIGFFAETGIEGLLDLYPGAYAAWSLRKLRNAYGGAAIEVTRTSDSATQDIGFVGEDLDTAALTSFIGANTGVVSVWYDQSGNSRDVTIGASQRPEIISSGTLFTLSGGKPTLRPTTGVLGIDTGLSGLTDKSLFFAGDTSPRLASGASRVMSGYSGGGALGSEFLISHYASSPDFLRYFDGGVNTTININRGEVVIGGYTNGGTIGIKANSVSTATNTGASPSNTNNYHLFEDVGGVINNELPLYGSEFILYNTSKDSVLSDIMDNQNAYYTIF